MTTSMAPSLHRAAAHTVRITLHNRPRNLVESKLVLQTLQKFGEVVTYRHLKYDPPIGPSLETETWRMATAEERRNSAIDSINNNNSTSSTSSSSKVKNNTVVAIYDTPESAARAIAASPIKIPLPAPSFPLPSRPARTRTHESDCVLSCSSELQPSNSTSTPPSPATAPSPIPTSDHYLRSPDPWAYAEAKLKAKRPKHMKICIDADSTVDHERGMELTNPYHSAYEIDTETYQYHDLTLNSKIPVRELADGIAARKERLPTAERERIECENGSWGAMSLMKLYLEGLENGRGEIDGDRAADALGRNGEGKGA